MTSPIQKCFPELLEMRANTYKKAAWLVGHNALQTNAFYAIIGATLIAVAVAVGVGVGVGIGVNGAKQSSTSP